MKSLGVQVPQIPGDSNSVPVRTLEFNDPGGQSLEVYAWLKR